MGPGLVALPALRETEIECGRARPQAAGGAAGRGPGRAAAARAGYAGRSDGITESYRSAFAYFYATTNNQYFQVFWCRDGTEGAVAGGPARAPAPKGPNKAGGAGAAVPEGAKILEGKIKRPPVRI